VSERKRPFSPITASDKKNNPQNIEYIPPVIFFVFLVLDEKSLFSSDTSYNKNISKRFMEIII